MRATYDEDSDDEESVSASEFDLGYESDEDADETEQMTQEERENQAMLDDLAYANGYEIWGTGIPEDDEENDD